MSRIFDHFPDAAICPVCKTSEDHPAVLVALDGTQEGNNEQATPVHVQCLAEQNWRLNREYGLLYSWVDPEENEDDYR